MGVLKWNKISCHSLLALFYDYFVFQPVSHIDVAADGQARAVVLQDGSEVKAKVIVSNATAKVTYLDLVDKVRTNKNLIQRSYNTSETLL